MRWLSAVNENIKKGIRSWLNVQPASETTFSIQETMTFDTNVLKNRVWYGGAPEELSQLYKQLDGIENKNRFWAAVPTPGREIRKIHTGIPAITVDTLTNIIMTDLDGITVPDKRKADWNEMDKENSFRELLEESVSEALYLGDGAFKLSLDPELSKYPIIEWIPADRIDIIMRRGRMKEVVFRSLYVHEHKEYILFETYGYGYIRYELHRRNQEEPIPLETIPELAALSDVEFDSSFCMAIPFMIYRNSKVKGRGKSIFDGKTDDYDALDEAWSQWMQALRDGRSTKYIPDSMIPRDPRTGEVLRPNAFDNQYIKTDTPMSEGSDPKIDVEQPAIPHESYNATYITALDLCLQGIISPSTIGIDVKKLDNAESQREKEKTTLYTRGKIVDAVQKTIPLVIDTAFKVLDLIRNENVVLEYTEASVNFGEYANPSFESQIETIGKAKSQSIMSNEAAVEELYGDTKSEEWKQEEIKRLNARDGVEVMKEPALNMEGLEMEG
ncbi:MAG TPA: capsid protein [Lachnospiraceae bacterium]|nr:capsid protein [Lachnospiraceae bacterium]